MTACGVTKRNRASYPFKKVPNIAPSLIFSSPCAMGLDTDLQPLGDQHPTERTESTGFWMGPRLARLTSLLRGYKIYEKWKTHVDIRCLPQTNSLFISERGSLAELGACQFAKAR